MDRLTEYSDLAGVRTGDLKSGVDERKAFDRLAAYEDTGLEPDEVMALIAAAAKRSAYWIDNADSYLCSCCKYETNNPNKEPRGPDVCPNCGAKMNSPNRPLTLEELRGMDGEPIWVTLVAETIGQKEGWAIVYWNSISSAVPQRWTTWPLWYDDYGKTWLAYRRKPEEGTI